MTNLQEQGSGTAASGSGVELLTILHASLIFLVVIHLFYFIFILIKQNLCKKSNVQPEKPENLRKINDSCSICLEELQCEVQLLCSHSYCAACIISYGKQRYNFADVQCPICRADSKLMFAVFERTDENKELYDQILNYNHEVTSHYPSSFCFCLDMFRLCQYYLRQLTNFSNPRFQRHRKVAILILLAAFIFLIYPFAHKLNSLFEICEDVIFYLFLIVACAEYFYRRIRSQTNSEFEIINSRVNTEDSNIEVARSALDAPEANDGNPVSV